MTLLADPREVEILDCLTCEAFYDARDGHRCTGICDSCGNALTALDCCDQPACLLCEPTARAEDVRTHSERCPDTRDRGAVSTAVLLLVCLFGGLAWLGLLHLGQEAMCELRDDTLRYCAGYEATR